MSGANVRRDGVGNPGPDQPRRSPGDATRIVGHGVPDPRGVGNPGPTVGGRPSPLGAEKLAEYPAAFVGQYAADVLDAMIEAAILEEPVE
jgi:hypothetical protein